MIAVAGSLTLTKAVKPGQYILQVVMDDGLAAPDHRTIVQSTDFEVVY